MRVRAAIEPILFRASNFSYGLQQLGATRQHQRLVSGLQEAGQAPGAIEQAFLGQLGQRMAERGANFDDETRTMIEILFLHFQ